MRALVCLAVFASCYDPDIKPGGFRCGDTNPICPSGFICSDGFCVRKASDVPDGKHAETGCADGTREGGLDQGAYPNLAACSGSWTRPGIVGTDAAQPHCTRGGSDCGPADLCADGWHLCTGASEVSGRGGQAACAALDSQPSVFFATAESGSSIGACGVSGDGNNVYGCGGLGATVDTGVSVSCSPLDRWLTSSHCPSPWICGITDTDEGKNVTKGPDLPSSAGGVLCCAN